MLITTWLLHAADRDDPIKVSSGMLEKYLIQHKHILENLTKITVSEMEIK